MSKMQKFKKAYSKATTTALVVGAPVALATSARADGLDMSSATTQLGLALSAVGLLGAAKIAPAALSWVWGLVTRNAAK